MDTDNEELYFQKIQELVHDDDKIVTVSSLASALGMSVQNARNLISKYVEDQRKLKPNDLAVTYVISGNLKDNGKKGVFMAKENDLESKRELFETTPFEIVYSVQKNKNVDFNIIALVDMLGTTNIREIALSGSIVSKNCTKRVVKAKMLPTLPPPTLKGKSSFFVPKPEASASSEKPAALPKTEQKAKTAGAIADLFKVAASKSKNGNGSVTTKPNKPARKLGGLTGFLTNGALASPKTKSVESKKENDLKLENSLNSASQDSIKDETIEITDADFDDNLGKEENKHKLNKNDGKVKEQERKKDNKGKQKGSKRQRDKSKESTSKRRKRIIEKNDSDSDDMFENGDTEDIIDRSDEEPERASSPLAQKPIVPKNKRRKTVTNTYKDEEGFVVTKTEYVYETASEDENVEPVPPKQEKKEEKQSLKTKTAEKKKPVKNQATLMNFFKKK